MTDDTTPAARILRAIRFHDRVFAVDLFDAMGVTEGERVAFAAAMARLVKTGKIPCLSGCHPTLASVVPG